MAAIRIQSSSIVNLSFRIPGFRVQQYLQKLMTKIIQKKYVCFFKELYWSLVLKQNAVYLSYSSLLLQGGDAQSIQLAGN